jgi:hypothetical protein
VSIFATLRQPAAMGTSLFLIAVIILSAVIIAGHAGLAAAMVLANIAQPICACAIAVLVYLAIAEQSLDPTA